MSTACVILAAGKSKRMRSGLVKVLHPMCDRPMIDYPVELALVRGYDPVVVVIGHQAEAVREHLQQRFPGRLTFAVQGDPLGTGHAVLAAERALRGVRGKLAVLYGDMPLLAGRDLGALERGGREAALAFLSCRLAEPRRYGRVLRDADGSVEGIVEYADASRAERRIDEINTGIYLMDSPWLFSALKRLGRGNAQGEYYLTDLVAAARQQGLAAAGVEVAPESVLGVNDRVELAATERALRLRLLERWMRKGVTVVDPATTFVGADVRLGADSRLEPGCHLAGRTTVGQRCTIGPGAVIRDTRIAAEVEVRAYSVLDDCRLGRGVQVGPFARLRPGTVLEPDARVGNFVETKKTRLGKGAKANHLSYLGDADIGAGVNVGAGTITCNYDGFDKHPTTVGAGTFIGSDVQLVAPVAVGRDALIGAGTTVTRNVPANALAVSRTRQRNIDGYGMGRRRRGGRGDTGS